MVGGEGRGLGVGRKSAGEVRREAPPSMAAPAGGSAPVSRGVRRNWEIYVYVKYMWVYTDIYIYMWVGVGTTSCPS